MTLGQRIQEHRLRLELSQEALGEKMGVSRQAVSKWEADGAVPDTDKLIALSKLFGISLNELLQVEDPPSESHVSETPQPIQGDTPGIGREKGRPQRLLPILGLSALLLGIAALVLSFGKTAGELGDRIAQLELRVTQLESSLDALEPAGMVAGWEIRPSEDLSYVRNGVRYQDVSVEMILARYDPENPVEVFFQLSANGLEPIAQEVPADGENRMVYFTTLAVPSSYAGGTLSVGFRQNGVEYLQPLAKELSVSSNQVTYIPLLGPS